MRSSSLKPIDDDDRIASESLRQQRDLDVRSILVAVADHQAVGRVEKRQRDQEFGFAARFEAHAEGSAELNDLFDDVRLLIDLDRVDAPPLPLVAALRDRVVETSRQRLDAACQDVGEADQHRAAQAAILEFGDELRQLDRGAVALARAHDEIAIRGNGKEVGAPDADLIEIRTLLGGPLAHRTIS